MQSPSTEDNGNNGIVQTNICLLSTPKKQFVAQWIDKLSRPESQGSTSSTENSIPTSPVVSSIFKRLASSPIVSNQTKRFRQINCNSRVVQNKPTSKSDTDESLKIDDNSVYSEPINDTAKMPPHEVNQRDLEIEHISDASFMSPQSLKITESSNSPKLFKRQSVHESNRFHKSEILKTVETIGIYNNSNKFDQGHQPKFRTNDPKQLIKIINENDNHKDIPKFIGKEQNVDESTNTDDDNTVDLFESMNETVKIYQEEHEKNLGNDNISDASLFSTPSSKITEIQNSQVFVKRRPICVAKESTTPNLLKNIKQNNDTIKSIDREVDINYSYRQMTKIAEKNDDLCNSPKYKNQNSILFRGCRKRLSKIIEENEDPNDSTEFVVHGTVSIPASKDTLNIREEKEIVIKGTQLIDCDSSSESLIDTKPVEFTSESDKTVSDFIEEVCSQNICELSPLQPMHNISTSTPIIDVAKIKRMSLLNPSTSATIEPTQKTDNTNCITISGTRLTQSNIFLSGCTSDSRVEFEQTILPIETKRKKKRKLKKGSLEERLMITMNKERSNVHIWRHQALHKPNELIDHRFVLLQIQTHYWLSNNQFFMCELIQDASGIFNEFIKEDRKGTVTILTIPEISGKVTVKYDTSLKVYRPWTILDSDVPLIQVSHFIILSNKYENQNSEEFKRNLHQSVVRQKFYCPCIEENRISDRCNDKFTDCKTNVIQEVFNYK